MSQTHLSTGVAGTFGYLAPEYASSGNLTDKADVYSFGIVMLEVVSGRKNYNPNVRPEDQLLLKVAWRLYTQGKLLDLVDRRMGDQYVPWEAARILHVALLCTQAAQSLRPSMSKVVYLLHGRSEISEVPTKPPSVFVESFEMQPHKPQSRKRPSVTLTSSSNASMVSSIFSET
ncbi:hypothetical protein KP509_26G033200 [Ceratopteris richardii]|nr:hypothetical protein KP509_26G033200 [Ceratopteris richardii]